MQSKHTLFLLALSFGVLMLGFGKSVYAVGGTISDQTSCESIGGTWDFGNGCYVTNLTINSDETLTISNGVILTSNFGGHIINNGIIIVEQTAWFGGGATLENFGTIQNFGEIITSSSWENKVTGIINNTGRIETAIGSAGSFDNYGTLVSNGYFENNGSVNNNFGLFLLSGIYQFTHTFNNHESGTLEISSTGSIFGGGLDKTFQNDGDIDNQGDIVLDCGTSITIGQLTGYPIVDRCNDVDEDGVIDDIDTSIAVSHNFTDIATGGTTSGEHDGNIFVIDPDTGNTVEQPGGILVSNLPNPEGVRISIHPESATQSVSGRGCDGSSEFTIEQPERLVLTCSSSIVESEIGEIEITFIGSDGTVITTTLVAPNKVTFKPDTLTFIADIENQSPIILVTQSGTITLNPGQTESLTSFCGRAQSEYNSIITGTEGNDSLIGTNSDDLIFGLGGDDKIKSKKGNDCIFGGDGDDKIWGAKGNDTINGDDGNDKIHGGQGSDSINGGNDFDLCNGGKGENSITDCEDRGRHLDDDEN